MDCQMPEMDGFEATRIIREKEKNLGRYTPIVALTADAMSGDREKCIASGMDDYLNKPVRPEQVTAMLEKWITRLDQRATDVPEGLLARIGGPESVRIVTVKLIEKMRADPDFGPFFANINAEAMFNSHEVFVTEALGAEAIAAEDAAADIQAK
jgi:DNA-binding response OmpR family regulator